MRALSWNGRALELSERPTPAAGDGEALVRVRLAGVCNTDLEIVRGYLGFEGVLGHEFVGEVERGPQEWVGKRVVGEINLACGSCPLCAGGLGRHCPDRRVIGIAGADGVFASHAVLPVAVLHEVPAQVPDEAAVFTEPLAAAFEILEQVSVAAGTEALVLGDGKLGLLIAFVLARAGARVQVVGKHDAHLELARARGMAAERLEAWDRAAAELVVDATGSADGLRQAVAATRPRGTLVLKTTVAGQSSLDLAPLVIHEISLIGSRCGPFGPALAALADGGIDPRPLIAARYPLERGVEAVARAAEPGVLKVLLEPSA